LRVRHHPSGDDPPAGHRVKAGKACLDPVTSRQGLPRSDDASCPVSTPGLGGSWLILVEDGLEGAVGGGVVGVLSCQQRQMMCAQARARMRTAWGWSQPLAVALSYRSAAQGLAWREWPAKSHRASRSWLFAPQRKVTDLTLPDCRVEGRPRRGRSARPGWGTGRGHRRARRAAGWPGCSRSGAAR
jgi:hypothetical protein